jgi:hypothetical protein
LARLGRLSSLEMCNRHLECPVVEDLYLYAVMTISVSLPAMLD